MKYFRYSFSFSHHNLARFPPWLDTWSELTNHVCVNSSIIIVRESIEGASVDLIWLVKFSLDHPQHFSVTGLKAHLPCQSKGTQGQGEKNDRRGLSATSSWPMRRQQEDQGQQRLKLRTKGLQTKMSKLPQFHGSGAKGPASLWQLPSLTCVHQKQPQPASSCCLALCFMVLMKISQRACLLPSMEKSSFFSWF